MLFLLGAVFIGIGLYEVPGLIRKKSKRELIAFSVLLLVGFILALLQTIGIQLPSPMKGFESLIKLLHLNY